MGRCLVAQVTIPYSDSLTCAACGAKLIPLSGTAPDVAEVRPNAKCPRCGQCYRLRGAALLAPVVTETAQIGWRYSNENMARLDAQGRAGSDEGRSGKPAVPRAS